ncbi:uncharacterized protein LOC116612234 [Nematostella vectensis]|uniref:uncharacterized protein LOC116612234 n=1 Tax=Nematostella vectensis TaxID=45351 RepID=UPI002077394A|nr:uncharacterized protein LOC116612234 [Nematostella vectensis]
MPTLLQNIFLLCLCVCSWRIGHTAKRGNIQSSEVELAYSLSDGLLRYAKAHRGRALPDRIDLVFVLDDSHAIGQRNFQSALELTKRIVQEFSVSPSTTRVALALCGALPRLHFGLDDHVNREGTLESLCRARFRGGPRCYLGSTLDMVQESLASSSTSFDTKRLVVLVTKSAPYDSFRAIHSAKRLKLGGIKLFRVGVDADLRGAGFDRVASWPLAKHSFRIPSERLGSVAALLESRGYRVKCSGNKTVYDECMRRCQCSAGQLVKCTRIRKDFPSMSLEERRRFISALIRVSTDQAFIKTYDKLTHLHPKFFDMVHNKKNFFPWHRWFILNFENFIRKIDCRVTVPYWDWSQAVSGNRIFRRSHIRDVWYPGNHGLGSNGVGKFKYVIDGPFRKGKWPIPKRAIKEAGIWLSRDFNPCNSMYLPKASHVYGKMLHYPFKNFFKFEDEVRAIHDEFHNAVGGTMMLACSSNAPEFWFHHGFLDKLWSDWQNRGAKFKFQYYHTIKTKMPGANVRGVLLVDLLRQPGRVRVALEQPKHDKEIFKPEEFDKKITDPTIIKNCEGNYDDHSEQGSYNDDIMGKMEYKRKEKNDDDDGGDVDNDDNYDYDGDGDDEDNDDYGYEAEHLSS